MQAPHWMHFFSSITQIPCSSYVIASTGQTLFAGALQMSDRIIRTGLGALSALLALVRIDISVVMAHGDGSKIAGILAGLSHTLAAVVGYYIGSNGTLLACSIDDLHHIGGVFACRTLALCKAHPLVWMISLSL